MSGIWETIEQIIRFDLSNLDGLSVTAIFFIIVFTTFLTEDGACLTAGALAGQGRISFATAVSACFVGILIGDVGLYFIGRAFGTPITRSALFRRFISKRSLAKASDWLEKRGVAAIFISRFVAGLRLPTYFAAGFLKTNFLKFLFFFVIAAIIWTPLLVGSAAFAQSFISPGYFFLSIVALYVLLHVAITLINPKKRRLLVGRLKRIARWEFWPIWIFYVPVVAKVLLLGIKHRGIGVFTAANPGIPAGGFIGESKDEIYGNFAANEANRKYLLRHHALKNLGKDELFIEAIEWMSENDLNFPVALKPDAGERGIGVAIIHSEDEMKGFFEEHEETDLLIQEFAKGPEISVFYYRHPDRAKGRIFSITKKEFPALEGDGERTLEKLILEDERAVCLAKKYFAHNEDTLDSIPAAGEKVQIVEVGSHSLGTIFFDGADEYQTEELALTIDEILGRCEGLFFGRFDLRADSVTELRDGGNFKIIEFNGVTSESTNIYDPKHSIFDAYAILFEQWQIAFEIGRRNIEKGVVPTTGLELIKLLLFRKSDSDS